jgi:hypothetical protein
MAYRNDTSPSEPRDAVAYRQAGPIATVLIRGGAFGIAALMVAAGSAGNWKALILTSGFGLMVAAFGLIFTRYAVVEFDAARNTIHYSRDRWPLRRARRTFAVADVVRAWVESTPGKQGDLYRTELVLRSEQERFPLLHVWSSGGEHRRVAEEINERLAKLRDENE